jgi:hypothetical protein
MVTSIVCARAETDDSPNTKTTTGAIRLGITAEILDLFDVSGDMLGVLLVALENLQARLQQALEFVIAC